MERMDDAQARRVWQRVQGAQAQTSEEALARMLELLQEDNALWQLLARRYGGTYQTLAVRQKSQLACLRGIWKIHTGKAHQPLHCPPPTGTREELLRQSYARQMALLQAADARTRDPEFGPIFAQLRDQQKNHCRMTLELLGKIR